MLSRRQLQGFVRLRFTMNLLEADAPPQRKALFRCSLEEKLKTAGKMIKYFEDEDKR
jgi:hypothetical protein